MQELKRGQKVKLSDLGASAQVEVGISLEGKPGQSIDISAFGLDANGKLSDDRYFIFYNQKTSPCGSVASTGAKGGDREVFKIDLSRLPATIQRIVFTATYDSPGTMADIGPSHLRILAGGRPVARFPFAGADFGSEKAVMIAELYMKDVWRAAAVGQGFAGGLSALLTHFGGEETGPAAAAAPAAPAPAPAPAPPAAKINLGKVTLEKRGARQVVDLKKRDGGGPSGAGRFHINLNWDDPNAGKKTGFFGKKTEKADLDLGCMFRLTDGTAGCIQPLGGYFGARHEPPFIYLDKDDRSGASTDGENLYLLRPDLIDKVVIFAMVYEGSSNFSHVNGRLTIKDDTGTEILIRLDSPDPNVRFCAVALIEKRGNGIEIVKEERYVPGHKQCDEHYGFGFRWTAGRK